MDEAVNIKNLDFAWPGGPPVLQSIDFTLKKGGITGIFGPNGAGKSTLLKCATGILKPRGTVRILGQNIHELPRHRAARLAAYVPPVLYSPYPYTVFDFAAMPIIGTPGWTPLDATERNRVMEALELVDMRAFADRPVTRLSSGEQKLALIARAIVQGSGVLMLDEPLANLDMGHAIRVMESLVRLRDERKLTVVCVSHEVNIPLQFTDTVILLNQRLVAIGPPEQVMLYPLLKDTFHTDIYIGRNEITGTLFMVPMRTKSEPD